MHSAPLKRLERKPVLRAEELDEAVASLRASIANMRNEFVASTRIADEVFEIPPVPDLRDLAESALRSFLEDEIIELEPVENNDIQQTEIRHEIMKKALVGLKLPQLRMVAARRGVIPVGSGDDLAQRVAASYGWDETAIAQLVLDHTEEPSETENGFSTRVFVLRQPADLEQIEKRLAYVAGRYIRTGTARWFVFEHYDRLSGSALELAGSLRTYRPRIEEGDKASLKADRTVSHARLRVTEDSRFVQVHGTGSAGTAKAMVSAFITATAREVLAYVPSADAGAKPIPGSLHPTTVFLLDLVTRRLRGRLFRRRNPILARFRLAKAAPSDVDHEGKPDTTRPRLSAVRFEGDYLLDSPSACRLMWTDGRPLVDLTLRVAARAGDSSLGATFPIRIAVEADHVLIATGLGTGEPELALEVHAAVEQAVQGQIDDGVDQARADALSTVISEQAERPEHEVVARLLADDMEKI